MGGPVPSMAEILRRAIESRLGDLYTAGVGEIQAYYPDTQTADIAPVVRRPLPTEDDVIVYEDLPILPNVPVLFPRGGAYSITWPLVKGDFCDLLIQTYSFAQWRQSGETSDAGDIRPHHLGNAIAIPGLAPNANPIDPAQASAAAIIIEGPAIWLGKDATEFIALAGKVDAQLTALKTKFAAWTPVAGDGGAALKTLLTALISGPPAWPASVAASKAKAK